MVDYARIFLSSESIIFCKYYYRDIGIIHAKFEDNEYKNAQKQWNVILYDNKTYAIRYVM